MKDIMDTNKTVRGEGNVNSEPNKKTGTGNNLKEKGVDTVWPESTADYTAPQELGRQGAVLDSTSAPGDSNPVEGKTTVKSGGVNKTD